MSPGAQTIALAPLSDAETSTLVAELLGLDPSVGEIGDDHRRARGRQPVLRRGDHPRARRTRRAGGRARRLHQLRRYRRGSACRPPCRRPSPRASTGSSSTAKQTLVAAAVIGSRFSRDLLSSLGIDPCRRRVDRRRAHRPGAVHPDRRVRVPASADPHRGLRITAEIRSRRAAPAAGRHDRIT